MSERKTFPRVSEDVLSRLKREVAWKFSDEPIVVRAFCWLLDKTDGLTRQVAVFAPSEYEEVGKKVALVFHHLRSGSHSNSIQGLMDQLGNGFTTWSCCARYVCGRYDASPHGYTFRLSVDEHHNTDEVEIPFDLSAIKATPLPKKY